MAERKKTVARLILQGICVLDILIGFCFLCLAITMLFPIPRDNLFLLCTLLLGLGIMLAIGVILIRDSYLMLRGKAFGAVKDFSVLVALIFFSLIQPVDESIKDKSISEEKAMIIYVFAFWLVYLIGVKLLKRLVKVAYGPEKISGARSSDSECKENTNVEAT